MVLWLIFAAMTAAAVLAVVWPLGRKARRRTRRQRSARLSGSAPGNRPRSCRRPDRGGGSGIGAHRNIASAVGRGGRRGAGCGRARIVGALASPRRGGCRNRRSAGRRARILSQARLAGRSRPIRLRSRSRHVPGDQSIASLVSQVEAHLASNPNDGAGWEVLAPVYLRIGRLTMRSWPGAKRSRSTAKVQPASRTWRGAGGGRERRRYR